MGDTRQPINLKPLEVWSLKNAEIQPGVSHPCHGNMEDHCCYFGGKVCPFLEERTMPDRRWVCGLMREFGNWDDVINSDRYQDTVVPLLRQHLWPHHKVKYTCKDWPAERCNCAH